MQRMLCLRYDQDHLLLAKVTGWLDPRVDPGTTGHYEGLINT